MQNVAANLLAPFAALQQCLSTTFTPFESNCIKRPAPPADKVNRITRISNDIPLREFKKRCKETSCTLNEACQSLMGVALKAYALRRGDTQFKQFVMASTFSLRPFPKTCEEIELGNHWVPQYLTIPVDLSFEKCLHHNKAQMRSLIGSSKLLGMQNFISVLLLLPFNLAKHSITLLSKKLTMTYSNMPTSLKPYDYAGYKCTSMTGFLPAVGDMLCGIVFTSHANVLKFGLITDTHYIEHPDEFMALMHRTIQDFLNREKTDNSTARM